MTEKWDFFETSSGNQQYKLADQHFSKELTQTSMCVKFLGQTPSRTVTKLEPIEVFRRIQPIFWGTILAPPPIWWMYLWETISSRSLNKISQNKVRINVLCLYFEHTKIYWIQLFIFFCSSSGKKIYFFSGSPYQLAGDL